MIKVEVTSTLVESKTGTSSRTGKSYSIREQECWLHTCDKEGRPRPHPERAVLPLDENQPAYPVGNYVVCPSSLYVGRFGMVGIRLKLRQTAPASAASAPQRVA